MDQAPLNCSRRCSRRGSVRAYLRLALLALLPTWAGCLVPLPLDQQNPNDGGQLLILTGAFPPFGTQRPTTPEAFKYQVELITDSPNVVGRLYIQVTGACCNLDLDTRQTSYSQEHSELTPIDLPGKRFNMVFGQKLVVCHSVDPGKTAYVVPVIATQGFTQESDGIPRPNGLGEVDRSHYWTVICPL